MKTDRARLKLRIRAAVRGERGVSMLEFAFVALPLFMFIFGILEVGLIFWGTYELDNATTVWGENHPDGQAQTNDWSQTDVIGKICLQVVHPFELHRHAPPKRAKLFQFLRRHGAHPARWKQKPENHLPLPARRAVHDQSRHKLLSVASVRCIGPFAGQQQTR